MDPFIETLKFLVPLAGVIAAVYNIFSSRTIAQDQAQKTKLEQSIAQGQENKKDIAALKEQVGFHKEATNERLDQIGKDMGFVKDLLVKWLLDSTKKT